MPSLLGPISGVTNRRQWAERGEDTKAQTTSLETKFNRVVVHKTQHMRLLRVKPGWRALERQHLPSVQVLFGVLDRTGTNRLSYKQKPEEHRKEKMGRAPCCDKDGLKKGPWLPEEDQKLVDYIEKHGPGNWRILPKKAGLQRCGKSCRLRWTNYLRPDIKRGRFSFEEEETIIQLHSILGNKWSAIAAKLPGRTDNEIKNYWNTHIRKRLLRMGIDPVTHTRRLDLMDLTSLLNSQQQNNSQLNLLKLLSLQTLVNPELLRLATLLSTNQNNGNLNFLLQNLQANQLADPMQNPNLLQTTNGHIQNSLNLPSCSTMTATNAPCASVIGDAQVMQPNLMQYQADISGFDAQSFGAHTDSMLNDQWPNNVLLGSEAPAPAQGYGKVEPDQSQFLSSDDQAIMGAWVDNSAFQSDNSNNQSLSSSQQTPLSSNSMYPNSSSEDEIDSYCRSLLNLDLPLDLFDV